MYVEIICCRYLAEELKGGLSPSIGAFVSDLPSSQAQVSHTLATRCPPALCCE